MTHEEVSIALQETTPWLNNHANCQALAALNENEQRNILACLNILKSVYKTRSIRTVFALCFGNMGDITLADQENFQKLVLIRSQTAQFLQVINNLTEVFNPNYCAEQINSLMRTYVQCHEARQQDLRDKAVIIELLRDHYPQLYSSGIIESIESTTFNSTFRRVLEKILRVNPSVLNQDIFQVLLGFRDFRRVYSYEEIVGDLQESYRIKAIYAAMSRLPDHLLTTDNMLRLIQKARSIEPLERHIHDRQRLDHEVDRIVTSTISELQTPDSGTEARLAPLRFLDIDINDERINHLIDIVTLEPIHKPCRLRGDTTRYYFEESTLQSLPREAKAPEKGVTFSPAITEFLRELGTQSEPFLMPQTFAHPLTRVRYSDADIQYAADQYTAEISAETTRSQYQP